MFGWTAPRPFIVIGLFVCCIAIQAFLVLPAALRAFPAMDEVGHLAAAAAHWRLGTFDAYRVNPPLIRLVCGWPYILDDQPLVWSGYSDRGAHRPEFMIGIHWLGEGGASMVQEFCAPASNRIHDKRSRCVFLLSHGRTWWVGHSYGVVVLLSEYFRVFCHPPARYRCRYYGPVG
ncbi:MAG: hypothetical protein KatS3mg111_0766 [Pirellulaceae bacterium]|nr:MAG: hypothetical protein KatS3mg111_0766 [Pirellulaceae bacterium]